MKRTKLLPLILALFTAGCGFIHVKTKGFGESTAKQSNESSSSRDDDGPARPTNRSDRPAGAESDVQNDPAFAKSMVDLLVGRAHRLTGFEKDQYQMPVGKGTFSIKTRGAYEDQVSRLVTLAVKHNPGKDARVLIQREACIQELLSGKKPMNRKQADYRCQTRTARDWDLFDSGKDIYLRGVFLDHALIGMNKKVKKQAVKRFLQSLGDEVVEFRVAVPDNDYGAEAFVLKDVPMEKWSQTTIRYGLRFAAEHDASPSIVAELEAAKAKAPTHKCITKTLVMAREHEGGGRYGELYWDARTHATAEFSERGDVDCASVNQKPNDAAVMSALRRDYDKEGTLLRAHYRSDSTWVVFYNNLDIPTMKRKNVQVYLRVET